MNIRRIIKEELLKEVGGYDDPNIMGQHASHVMEVLSNSYNDLSNTIQGLANAIMDRVPKSDLVTFLDETSHNIDLLVNVIKSVTSDFTEDDLVAKAKMIVKSLNSFKRKIGVLINFADAMGNDEEFIERVKDLLIDLVPSLQEYGEQLYITNKMFGDRLSGMGRSQFGSGFSSN
jgi:hypothetical protein